MHPVTELCYVQGMSVYQPPVPMPGHPGYFFVPGAASPAQEGGPMPLHSAQHGVMWEQPGPGYGPGPLGSMQARVIVCHDLLNMILQCAP
jgi:hypothetical protein